MGRMDNSAPAKFSSGALQAMKRREEQWRQEAEMEDALRRQQVEQGAVTFPLADGQQGGRRDGWGDEYMGTSAATEAGHEDGQRRCSAATRLQAAHRGWQTRHPNPAAAGSCARDQVASAGSVDQQKSWMDAGQGAAGAAARDGSSDTRKPAHAPDLPQPDGWPKLAPNGLPEDGSVFRNGFTGGVRPSSSPAWSSADYIHGADYTSIGCQNPELASWKPAAATWNCSFQRGSWDIGDATLPEARSCQAADAPDTCTSSSAPSVDDNVTAHADGASGPAPASEDAAAHADPGVDGGQTEQDVAERSNALLHLSSQIALGSAGAADGNTLSATDPSYEGPTEDERLPAMGTSHAENDECADQGGEWQSMPGLGLGEDDDHL